MARKIDTKKVEYCKLKEELVILKTNLEKTMIKLNIILKFEKSSEILTNIIHSQRPSKIKKGIGCEREENKQDNTFKGFIKEGSSNDGSYTEFKGVGL